MKILITQRELLHPGGSEFFTIEAAKELCRRGHEVAIYSPRVGDMTRTLLNAGVWVVSELGEVPWTPQIIHGQHHLQAVAAMSYFENTPAVYHCHGSQAWVEQPPVHSRIRYYIMMCEWMALRMAPEFGVSADRVRTISNFVDTRRFSRVRTPPPRPARALLFGNGGLPAREVAKLETACAALGITLEKIGSGYGNLQMRPEMLLPDYDLVFAIGRCAMEALACGCAVITVMPGLAGRLVTTENLDEWVYSNFSPRFSTSAAQVETAWLEEELKGYSPENITGVSQRVRMEHDMRQAIDRLEEIHGKAVAEHREQGPKPAIPEPALYLEKVGPQIDAMWIKTVMGQENEVKILHEQLQALLCQMDDQKREMGDRKREWAAEAALLNKNLLRRWFLRRIKRVQKTFARFFPTRW